MLSRFGASLGSQSQPWLAPKRLISPDQSPSRPCPDGVTANEVPEHVGIRCHPVRGLPFCIATTDGFHRRLHAVATIVAKKQHSSKLGCFLLAVMESAMP